ncbi:MAG: DUF3794 domain-containing protein [Lachnospiraceae bacterium]|nr:DUF3794 domain-containing protein [Lachnospiraceae bacterium]
MDLLMKKIHMCRQTQSVQTQMTLDEDFNVPDVSPDVGMIIWTREKVVMEHTRIANGMVFVDGFLEAGILYMDDTKERQLHRMNTRIPFDEEIAMEGLKAEDDSLESGRVTVSVRHETEDLSVTLINSRKLAIRALISIEVLAEETADLAAAVDIQSSRSSSEWGATETAGRADAPAWQAGTEPAGRTDPLARQAGTEPALCERKEKLEYLQLEVQNKDILRLKEDVQLPSNKPNIREILWEDVQLRGCRTQISEGKLAVRGSLFLFVLYRAEDEKQSLQWIEQTVPAEGELALPPSDVPRTEADDAGLVPDIEVTLSEADLTAKEDLDGELRTLHLEGMLDLNIRIYGTDTVEVLSDVYSPDKDLELVSCEETFETLVVRNESKCRVQGKIRIQSAKPRILQICHGRGSVKIDKTEAVGSHNLRIEGALPVSILYISSDDTQPFAVLEGTIPFSHEAQAQEIDESCRYTLRAALDQLSATMSDSEEIEIRASVTLDLFAVRPGRQRCIHEIHEKEYEPGQLEAVPGMTGYIVQEGETLWDIAKQYFQTPQQIMEMNGLSSEQVRKGDCLILMKHVRPAGV